MRTLNISVFTPPPLVDIPCHITIDRICRKNAVILFFLKGLRRDCPLSHSCPAIFPDGGAEFGSIFIDED